MKLAIISHTEHYKTKDGSIVGWGATINEINHLLDKFDTIFHIAMMHSDKPPLSALPYASDRIIFVPLPVLGGTSIKDKLKIIYKAPQVIQAVNKTLKLVDCFQLRTPTGIGVFLIPFLSLCVKKKGWYKYAGNWNQEKPPLGYQLQRWMLQKQSRKVTINGYWPNQPPQYLTFENPCLTLQELEQGHKVAAEKSIQSLLTICYVGRLEKPKGVERIIKALGSLSLEEKERIELVHLVGDGADREYFEDLSKTTGVCFKFHGSLSRDSVFEIYKKSHIFLMPTTASEGFPKVIAESMNYGCIPIVSNISSIGHYIKDKYNGFLLLSITEEGINEALRGVLKLSKQEYRDLILMQKKELEKFTYTFYNNRIINDLLSD